MGTPDEARAQALRTERDRCITTLRDMSKTSDERTNAMLRMPQINEELLELQKTKGDAFIAKVDGTLASFDEKLQAALAELRRPPRSGH